MQRHSASHSYRGTGKYYNGIWLLPAAKPINRDFYDGSICMSWNSDSRRAKLFYRDLSENNEALLDSLCTVMLPSLQASMLGFKLLPDIFDNRSLPPGRNLISNSFN